VKVLLAASAADRGGFPKDDLPEVAFLGRSNVGKSSLLNALVGRRALARTSAAPGKTRLVHFYRVEDACYLVDLPGYGYAAVSKAEQKAWRPRVESYLRGTRRALVGALVLVDLRRGLEEEERDLLAWLAREEIPANLVLTKADKLSSSRAAARLREIAREVGLPQERLALVSSRTRGGLATVVDWIHQWTGVTVRDDRSAPATGTGRGSGRGAGSRGSRSPMA
jgi:GTP-binding protein